MPVQLWRTISVFIARRSAAICQLPMGFKVSYKRRPTVNKLTRMIDLPLHNPLQYLQDKHEWLRAPEEEREDIRRRTGTIFTEIDRLPGWYAPICSPIDGMHLFDLGVTKRICQDIIVKAGLLHPRTPRQPDEERPYRRFDEFLKRTYFPSHCSRLPPTV